MKKTHFRIVSASVLAVLITLSTISIFQKFHHTAESLVSKVTPGPKDINSKTGGDKK